MKNYYLSCVTMTVVLLSCVQMATAQDSESFLDEESRPKGDWLPAPPSMTDGAAKVYDLQGRLIEGQPTEAGVYISEGKKIVNQ